MLDIRGGFGVDRIDGLSLDDGVWTGRSGPLRFRWSGAGDAQRRDDGSLRALIEVTPGDDHDLILEISDRELPAEMAQPNVAWRDTERAWAQAVPAFTGTLADLDVQSAYAVMRGLTSSGGGMVAAATMSLPERAAQGRNYDYRYCWIRDPCLAGQAVAAAGSYPLLDDAVRFISERVLEDGPALKPAYCVTGAAVPTQQDLDLPGYPGATVKTGNSVAGPFQLDAFGEALLLLASAARLDRLDNVHWRAAQTLVQAIDEKWRQPDAASGKSTIGAGRIPGSSARRDSDKSVQRLPGRRVPNGSTWPMC